MNSSGTLELNYDTDHQLFCYGSTTITLEFYVCILSVSGRVCVVHERANQKYEYKSHNGST